MPKKPKTTLPDFTPVPRAAERSNGWKPEVQRAFIEALAETGSVQSACRRVGRATVGAYLLRRHPEAAEFRAAWQAALDIGIQRIEDIAMDRAINGTEEPVWSYGKLLGTRTRYNDGLLMFMLRSRAPGRFTGGRARAMNAADKETLKKLKKQWRKEWAAEDAEDEKEVYASLDQFLDKQRNNRLANMSPAQRERQIAADAQARADEAAGWGPGEPYGEFAAAAAELLPRFVAEVEADWPPLPPWAWEAPAEEDEEPDPLAALPPPAAEEDEAEEPEEPSPSPRVRSIKDEGW